MEEAAQPGDPPLDDQQTSGAGARVIACPTTRARLLLLLATGSAVVLALSLGAVLLRPSGAHVALWWPAAAFSVALVVAMPRTGRWRSAAVCSVLVVSAGANALAGRSGSASVLLGVCNAAEAAVVAGLLQRRTGVPALCTMPDLGRFLAACAAGAVTVALSAAVVLTWLEGAAPVGTATSVFTSHGSALVLLLPLGMRTSTSGGEASARERLAQAAALVGVIAATFTPTDLLGVSLAPGAALAWAALRCSSRWVIVQTTLTGLAVSGLTLAGRGPYDAAAETAGDPQWAITYVQLFILIVGAVVLSMCVTVAERRAALAEVQRLATHDWLTGTGNRRLLDDRLEQAQHRAARGEPAALLLLDLDGFKAVNDHDGHQMGDHVLVTVAERLSTLLREVDLVARLGGDEFVLLLEGLTWPSSECDQLCARIEAAVERPVEGVDRVVGASIGGTAVRSDLSHDEMLQAADADMYLNKAVRKGGSGDGAVPGQRTAQRRADGAAQPS